MIDTRVGRTVASVDVGSGPRGVAVAPDGSQVYVTNERSGSISDIDTRTRVIDTATGALVKTIDLDSPPDTVAVAPDGSRVYVTNPVDDAIWTIPVDAP